MRKIIPAILLGGSCWLMSNQLPAQTDDTNRTDDPLTTVAPKSAAARSSQDVQQQPGRYRHWQGRWWYWMPGTPGQWYVYNDVAWTPYRPGMTVRELHQASIGDLNKDELALYAFTGTKEIPQRPESLNPTQNDTPQLGVAAGTGLNGAPGGGIIGGRQTGQTYNQLMNRYGAANGVGSTMQSPYQIGGLPGANALPNRGGAATNGPNTNLNSSQSQFSQLAGQGSISTVAPGLNTGGTQPAGSPGSPALSNGGQIGAGGTPVGSLGGGGISSGTIGASSAAGSGLSGVSGATGGGTGAAAGSAGAGGAGGAGAAGAGGGGAGGGH